MACLIQTLNRLSLLRDSKANETATAAATSSDERHSHTMKIDFRRDGRLSCCGLSLCLTSMLYQIWTYFSSNDQKRILPQVARWQNLIPSFPWIVPPPRSPPWRNPRKGRDQILSSGNLGQNKLLIIWWKVSPDLIQHWRQTERDRSMAAVRPSVRKSIFIVCECLSSELVAAAVAVSFAFESLYSDNRLIVGI